MKVMTVLGTRPEIIRLSVIMKKLDKFCNHITFWTGQNYDEKLTSIFFKEFGTRSFDYDYVNEHSSDFFIQVPGMMKTIGQAIKKEKPDKLLVLGDTNSSLAAAIVSERMGVPVYHMEAGNRCFDMKVPEEKNRIVIDSISSFNMPYVRNSKENLIREGFPKERIFVTGNPIYEVYQEHSCYISNVLKRLSLKKDRYILLTAHRAENVDDRERFNNLINAVNEIAGRYCPVIFSVHPRTKARILEHDVIDNKKVICHEPFNFIDFTTLEKNAFCIITDSGTVQEEACIFGIPCLVIRDSTERPETVEAGNAIVSGLECKDIIKCFEIITREREHNMPEGYMDLCVSDKVISFVLGNQL